jgi:hypothetical protein
MAAELHGSSIARRSRDGELSPGSSLRIANLLWKSPGFSIAAVATLALGIGATAVLFSILDGAYIHFGQTEQANRAILLTQRFSKLNSDSSRFSPAEYVDITGLHGSFDGFLRFVISIRP